MATTATPARTPDYAQRQTTYGMRRMAPATIEKFFDLCDGMARRNGNRAGKKHALALVTNDIQHYNCAHGGAPAKANPGLYGQISRTPGKTYIYIAPGRSTMDQWLTLAHEYAHHHTTGGHTKAWRRAYAMFLVALAITLQTNIDMDREIRRCADRYISPERDNTPNGYWVRKDAPSYKLALQHALADARYEMHRAADKANDWFHQHGYAI